MSRRQTADRSRNGVPVAEGGGIHIISNNLLQSSWKIAPVKHIFSVVNGSTPSSSEQSYWDGHIYWATPEDIGSLDGTILFDTKRKITDEGYNNSGTHIAAIGSIVLTTRAPVGNLAITGVPLCTNQGCKTLIPRSPNLNTTYFYYQLLARKDELLALSTGTTFQELSTSELQSLNLWFPPLATQRAIAAYLDAETAKIDALIDAKRRLLALLAEKRRALITHAVTRGLNPDAPLRDSGVPWIGQVPAHWEIVNIKYIARIGNGSTPSRDNAAYWQNGTFPWITSTVVNDNEVGKPVEFVTEKALRECHLPIVEPDSVLVAITGEGKTRGKAALLRYHTTINQHMAYISPTVNKVLPEVLQLFLSGFYEVLRLISEGTGSTKGALTCEQLGGFPILMAPIDEQHTIVRYLQTTTKRLDTLSTITEQTVSLLNERRAALIAAAVTGQIDVEQSHADYVLAS